jgi:hypothetical protein
MKPLRQILVNVDLMCAADENWAVEDFKRELRHLLNEHYKSHRDWPIVITVTEGEFKAEVPIEEWGTP